MVRINIWFIALGLSASLLVAPARSQTQLAAPNGWTTQSRANGARVFTPPDLAAGEVYNIAIYDSSPLDGKTLEEWLRAFAGPVGKQPGQLASPLQIKVAEGRLVSGTGVYAGPNGKALGVTFIGVSLDGGTNIHAARTLFSSVDVLERYQSDNLALLKSLSERAKREGGGNILRVPAAVTGKMKPGGELVPGVYAGNQFSRGELLRRVRVYLYSSGEYRITDHNDQDFKSRFGSLDGVGQYSYNRNSGQLELDSSFDLGNDRSDPEEEFCYYGRDAEGKPLIYAEEGVLERVTTLRYVGPPTKRLSPKGEEAREAAIEAEKKRYKFVTEPGKGVPNANIAAVVHHYVGMGTSKTDEAYLLLKDGTVHAGLPVPPDQLDVTRSRQKEPSTWGRWRLKNGKYLVSWDGAPYQALPGTKAAPAPAQLRLAGRYGTGWAENAIIYSSYAIWGVTFNKAGRFIKDRRGGSSSGNNAPEGSMPAVNSAYDDTGSVTSATGAGFAFASSRKKNPNGDREGTYSINGYTLTLRYDNGKVARLPFFFSDKARKLLWFEGDTMSLDEK